MLDITSFDAALKDLYTAQAIKKLAYKRNPFLAVVPKFERFVGRKLPIQIVYGLPKGRSRTFANAQGNAAGGDYEAFELTRVSDYGVIKITAETMEASASDAGAFLSAREVEYDGIIRATANSLGSSLFRSGTGSVGQVANTVFTGDVITLTAREDVVNFEVGQVLEFSTAAEGDGGALMAGDLTITAVDRSAGTLTMSADLDSIGAGAMDTNSWIYVQGDGQDDAAALSKIAGLAAWIPTTAPGATAFFGVDRSEDPDRLGGIRVSATGATLEEAFIETSARLNEVGAEPDLIVMNPLDVGELLKALGSKARYGMEKSPDMASVGFRTVTVTGVDGDMPILADRGCQRSRFYMLQKDTWKLYSLGQAPKLLNLDGLSWLRATDADSYESRVGYRAQLGCNAPGLNAVCSF